MREGVIGLMLCIQSYWDIRYKEIPSIVSAVGGILGVCIWYQTDKSIVGMILSLIPGILCLLCGRISKEAIGYGDGIVICVLGMYYTLEELLVIGAVSISAAGIYGLVLLVLFHKDVRYEIPFVPFLLFGWFIRIMIIYGGF